jgi:alpha-L-glutamate ligase-like protein
MFKVARRLRDRGVLGVNGRNARYVRLLNPRHLYPLVDDKLRTKELAIAAGMAVPELYGIISTQHDARLLGEMVGGRDQFVIKPARGSGGNGIFVVRARVDQRYRLAGGQILDESDIMHHVSSTLSGLYSLGGQRDRVMLEYCVQFDPVFEDVSYQGVPDIRVIVYRGYPIMSMVRLPTRRSDGKANLHQGAVGVGIDMATGTTLQGVQDNHVIAVHPDTGHSVAGISVPGWETILGLAARCWELTGLGYLGVDIVLDRDQGPLILELNARPGLNIQIANARGLERRLLQIDAAGSTDHTLEERVATARELLGH